MKALHRRIVQQIRETAELLAILESMCDATIEYEFDLVEYLLDKIQYSLEEIDLNELKTALDNARNNNERS